MNKQKGFVIPLVITVVALLAIGTAFYFFKVKKSETPVSGQPSATIDQASLNISSNNSTITGTAINTNTVSVNIFAPSPAKPFGMNWFGNENIPVVDGHWSLSVSQALDGMSNFSPLTLQIGVTDASGTVKNLATGTLAISPLVNFSSPSLGLGFEYDPHVISITEKDNIISVNFAGETIPSGDYFQVFNKDTSSSITDAIKKNILTGYPSKYCKIDTGTHPQTDINGWITASLEDTTPGSDGPVPSVNNCNTDYLDAGSPGFFLYNPNYPSKFLFWRGGAALNTSLIFSTLSFSKNQNTVNVSVAGMSQYTDSNFGFSFWYPTSWKVQSTAIKNNYVGGTIQKTLTMAPSSITIDPNGWNGDAITINEFSSPTSEITIPYDLCSPMSDSSVAANRYYFNTETHTWMVETPAHTSYSEKDASQYSVPTSTIAANVSSNTMGGLHMLGAGCSGAVIPLSAHKFIVFLFNSRNVGPYYINIAKTITATDLSVATPVSFNEQVQTITKAAVLLGALGTRVGEWYVTSDHVYNWTGDVIVGANPSTFRLINKYSDGTAGTQYATDGVQVYSSWSADTPILSGADPATFVAIGQQYQIPYATSSGLYGQSFSASDTQFAKDRSHVWYQGKPIPNADPNTFVVTGDTYVQNSTGGDTLAHDANHLYGVDAKGKFTIDGITI